MCDDCIERVAHMIGTILEENDIPLDFAFSAVHAVGRVIERQTGMPIEDMAELQFYGRELGEEIADGMDMPDLVAEGSEEEDHRDLILKATMSHHREKPS